MSRPLILVVDDESHIVELVRFNLEKGGYRVIEANDGISACNLAKQEKPDLIILDVMLPGMDGLEVCRMIQKDAETSDIPIIMLTARSEEIDKILGLEIGADDYITKPFSPRELLARVKARLRRAAGKQVNGEGGEGPLKVGGLVIDTGRFEVFMEGTRLELTPKEFELLKILARSRGRVLSREFLLENIWGYEYIGDSRTVDVHIRHLRQKVEDDPANPKYIETVRGIGYRFKENS
ncbi:MAG: DNA-binding response regulator [Firmicutes bacterium HGW-Firmicutes-14]|nr:MAG: DNA-binding response regulator [Firmicutes bacterium HGW-Firmicutes-14]